MIATCYSTANGYSLKGALLFFFFPFLETEPFVLEGCKTVKYYLN